MKKKIFLILCIMSIFSLSACCGNVCDVKSPKIDSKMYSQDEINDAIDVIKNEFKEEWKECTLKELYYAGDAVSKNYEEWADRYDAKEVMVLSSVFDVGENADDSLNPNSTNDWIFILVRSDNGKWKHVDHGFL